MHESRQKAETFGKRINELVAVAYQNEKPDGLLIQWFSNQPSRVQSSLIKWGLLPHQESLKTIGLDQNIKDYELSLRARNKSETHITYHWDNQPDKQDIQTPP
jgi:hypothetical protein